MDDSGSKALSSLRTVFDIDRLVERLTFRQSMASTTATRSWNEGSIFTLSFALIWGPVVALCSDSPSAWLFKNCHQSALYKVVKHFTIGCKKKTSELAETSYWPITENTHVVQLLIAYRNKSAASNSTFICSESSLLFFSTRWMVVSRVVLMLNRSDSLAFGGRLLDKHNIIGSFNMLPYFVSYWVNGWNTNLELETKRYHIGSFDVGGDESLASKSSF